jgi:hypothetical protein
MFKTLLVFLLSVITYSSFAQVLRERIYIKGGDEFWENFSKEMFLYPSFKDGTIEYKNGKLYKSRLNYNRALGTIQFITDKNDTLALANEENIKLVKIGNDVFEFNPFCVQVVNGDRIRLSKSEKLQVSDARQIGAYGKTNTTAGVDSYNKMYTWLGAYELSANEVLLCSKNTTFYIVTNDHELVPAGRKNILRAFASKENAVKKFIDSKNINFTREADLLELTNYISSL